MASHGNRLKCLASLGVPVNHVCGFRMKAAAKTKKTRGRKKRSGPRKKKSTLACASGTGVELKATHAETSAVGVSDAGQPAPQKSEAARPPDEQPELIEADAGELQERDSGYDSDTAIRLYLREIGQIPLLTPEQEVELAKRIKRGDKKAREEMIRANLRLVVKIARDYEGLGLPLLDLISEGNIGLMKAVERFDPAKGGKLSTYSAWWIKQAIKRALANQSKTIRLPVHMVDKISRMRKIAHELEEELGREPTDEELAFELGTTPAKVALMRQAAIRPASLDAPIGDDNSNTFGEVVGDERARDPYSQLEEETVKSMLRELLKTLDARESTILTARFGLDGNPPMTLEEVGKRFGVTRERIRQIQNAALKKLRRMIEKLESQQV